MQDKSDINVKEATAILKKMSSAWSKRAQIRKINVNHPIPFDDSADDFLVRLLPFSQHPYFIDASYEMKRKILSCGWMIYNQKTLVIETEIINPACVNILQGFIPGADDFTSKKIASETMMDEFYHVSLVLNAIELTSLHRNLFITMPSFNIVRNMRRLQSSYTSNWEKIIIQLVTAIVSEIFISDYLKWISDNETIQPINRFSVNVHREDEFAHRAIFKNLTKCIYVNLNREQKEFFACHFIQPIQWFDDLELDCWKEVLKQIHFPHAETMIKDCQHNNIAMLPNADYAELISLANEIGIRNTHQSDK
jgi:hypothetical protein